MNIYELREKLLANAEAIDRTGARATIEVPLDEMVAILQDHHRQQAVIDKASFWLACGVVVMDKVKRDPFGSSLAEVVEKHILNAPPHQEPAP